MLLNAALLWPAVVLGAYILFVKSLALFIPYVVLWVGIMTVNRYSICCPCRYYGEDCPTFGWSYPARLFPRRAGARFSARAARAEAAETIIIVCLFLVAWVLSAFGVVGPFTAAEHIIMSVYGVLAISAVLAHQTTGCGRCEVAECPLEQRAGTARPRRRRTLACTARQAGPHACASYART